MRVIYFICLDCELYVLGLRLVYPRALTTIISDQALDDKVPLTFYPGITEQQVRHSQDTYFKSFFVNLSVIQKIQ